MYTVTLVTGPGARPDWGSVVGGAVGVTVAGGLVGGGVPGVLGVLLPPPQLDSSPTAHTTDRAGTKNRKRFIATTSYDPGQSPANGESLMLAGPLPALQGANCARAVIWTRVSMD